MSSNPRLSSTSVVVDNPLLQENGLIGTRKRRRDLLTQFSADLGADQACEVHVRGSNKKYVRQTDNEVTEEDPLPLYENKKRR